MLRLLIRRSVQASRPQHGRHIAIFSPHRSEYRLPEEAREEFVNETSQFTTAQSIPLKGKIYDKKPFRMQVKKGQRYMWCACGHSHSQPLCDCTHREAQLRIKLRPVKYVPDRDREVWLCQCKQTNHRPFCDGSHRHPDVQAAVRG